MADEPNQGATGTTPAEGAADAPPPGASESPSPDPADPGVNQGAAGNRPLGESPLSVESKTDAFAERPEAYVGAAFAGGLVLALMLRRFTR